MFEKIKELSFALNSDADMTKYKNVKEARKVLQEIKVESQALRMKINEDFKVSKSNS